MVRPGFLCSVLVTCETWKLFHVNCALCCRMTHRMLEVVLCLKPTVSGGFFTVRANGRDGKETCASSQMQEKDQRNKPREGTGVKCEDITHLNNGIPPSTWALEEEHHLDSEEVLGRSEDADLTTVQGLDGRQEGPCPPPTESSLFWRLGAEQRVHLAHWSPALSLPLLGGCACPVASVPSPKYWVACARYRSPTFRTERNTHP